MVGDRTIYDHYPIWMQGNQRNWGLELFKLFNYWFENEGLFLFVVDVWNSLVIRGKASYILKEKLKQLKPKLKI